MKLRYKITAAIAAAALALSLAAGCGKTQKAGDPATAPEVSGQRADEFAAQAGAKADEYDESVSRIITGEEPARVVAQAETDEALTKAEQNGAGSEPDGAQAATAVTEAEKTTQGKTGVAYTPRVSGSAGCRFVRTAYIQKIKSRPPLVWLIKSKAELEGFCKNYQNCFYLGGVGSGDSFESVAADYDEEYFSTKSLVLVFTEESSGSVAYQHAQATEDGKIYITRSIPEVRTCDMAYWFTFIELDKAHPILSMHTDEIEVVKSE